MRRLLTTVALAIVLGWVSSTLIVLVYGKLVPQTYTNPELQAFQERLKTHGYLTKEELEEMDRKAALLHEEVQRRLSEEDRSLWLSELRRRALVVSWVPWALLGFVGLRDIRAPWLVSITLFLLVMIHAHSIEEALAFSAATVMAFYFRKYTKLNR